eukprot:1564578-Prymnesium_polylepis.1
MKPQTAGAAAASHPASWCRPRSARRPMVAVAACRHPPRSKASSPSRRATAPGCTHGRPRECKAGQRHRVSTERERRALARAPPRRHAAACCHPSRRTASRLRAAPAAPPSPCKSMEAASARQHPRRYGSRQSSRRARSCGSCRPSSRRSSSRGGSAGPPRLSRARLPAPRQRTKARPLRASADLCGRHSRRSRSSSRSRFRRRRHPSPRPGGSRHPAPWRCSGLPASCSPRPAPLHASLR